MNTINFVTRLAAPLLIGLSLMPTARAADDDVERDKQVSFGSMGAALATWRHLSMPKATGHEVAQRLTEIGPKPADLVVQYDGWKNTFHVWYRGAGSGTRYRYAGGTVEDLRDGPVSPFGFINDGRIVPAGIGGIGDDAVLIYFLVE